MLLHSRISFHVARIENCVGTELTNLSGAMKTCCLCARSDVRPQITTSVQNGPILSSGESSKMNLSHS